MGGRIRVRRATVLKVLFLGATLCVPACAAAIDDRSQGGAGGLPASAGSAGKTDGSGGISAAGATSTPTGGATTLPSACSGTAPPCASSGPICSDVFVQSECVGAQWRCPNNSIPVSQCSCFGFGRP
ncbi:MAG: hypothetical protein ABW061_28490, partial [Polyangiaceae bacterium]